jgi:hypothetical protein
MELKNNKISFKTVASKIIEVAKKCESEEDVKIYVQRIIDNTLENLGIDIDARYEKTIYKSRRADALYPSIVIEYKKPKALRKSLVKERAKEELKDYLKGLAKKEKVPRKFVGVAIDGFNILFIRSKPTKLVTWGKKVQLTLHKQVLKVYEEWEVIGPRTISEETIEQLFLYFRSLSFKTLNPENLVNDFGPKNLLAKDAIRCFYRKLDRSKNPKLQTLFNEWSRIFGIVYGKEVGIEEKNVKKFALEYGLKNDVDFKKLLFCIHTYLALLMKMIAVETLAIQRGFWFPSFVQKWKMSSSEELKNDMMDLENGGPFKRSGIVNFLEGDFFNWYLEIWDQEIASVIRGVASRLSHYEPATSKLEPSETRDLLKKLYQFLVPKEIRHDLGEYYTPDWLAELLLDEIGYNGDPHKRLIDPACGSGTFIVLVLKRILNYTRDNPESYSNPKNIMELILNNIVGFDINPLAVLASRTNYLLALMQFKRQGKIEIPIYLCDSILTPERYSTVIGQDYKIQTSVGDFSIPRQIVKKNYVETVFTLLEEVLSYNGDGTVFIERVRKALPIRITEKTVSCLGGLYRKFEALEREGKNHVWARIITNNFAPLFKGKFDYIIGNPPWVRWTYLSDSYRNATWSLWQKYGLFTQKGIRAKMGTAELDFSMLFLYACIDFLGRKNGKLGFLITQEVFKSKKAGEGFRRFQIKDKNLPLKVVKVHDLVKVKPFEGVANKTSLVIMQKSKETKFPLPYIIWNKKRGAGTIYSDFELPLVFGLTERRNTVAQPVDKPTDPWQTIEKGLEKMVKKMMGKAQYKARIGARVEPYGVFWMKTKSVTPEGLVIVENLPEMGKNRELKKIERALETELIFPIVRGKDINRWYAKSEISAIIVNRSTRKDDIPKEKWMKINLPKSYSYLFEFKEALLSRKNYWKFFAREVKSEKKIGHKKLAEYSYFKFDRKDRDNMFVYLCSNAPFYTMFNVGDYTFSKFKVVWSRMASDLKAAVISTLSTKNLGKKIMIPTDTTSLIPVDNEDEAHYICALLNSTATRFLVRSFSSAGRGFGAPSILKYIKIPKFDAKNRVHKNLSKLSRKAHQLAVEGKESKIENIEKRIDRLVAKFWKIEEKEFKLLHSP